MGLADSPQGLSCTKAGTSSPPPKLPTLYYLLFFILPRRLAGVVPNHFRDEVSNLSRELDQTLPSPNPKDLGRGRGWGWEPRVEVG